MSNWARNGENIQQFSLQFLNKHHKYNCHTKSHCSLLHWVPAVVLKSGTYAPPLPFSNKMHVFSPKMPYP